jgi:hypothetical protein
MVAIPAWVWRFGLIVRALIAGLALGVFVGLLAWIGSDVAAPALVVLVVVTLVYGAFMARWMSKYWPGAKDLSGPDRVAVVRAARRGRDIGDPRLAPGVIEYSRALQTAAERFRLWWWLIALLGVVALGAAIADTIYAPVREVVVSWLYFAFFPIEAWWWPRRQAGLLANAERAEQSASRLLAQQAGPGG